jgi:hypothetical protein
VLDKIYLKLIPLWNNLSWITDFNFIVVIMMFNCFISIANIAEFTIGRLSSKVEKKYEQEVHLWLYLIDFDSYFTISVILNDCWF